jgi:Na+-transporting NADH:ubiquinone oxidoreductase subunit NqrB
MINTSNIEKLQLLTRPSSRIDPRHYQLFIQSCLLIWGLIYLDFVIPLSHIITAFGTTLLSQTIFTRYHRLPANLFSTLNTTLSILLLLHANHWFWIALACFIAISSKFLVRIHNKHLFNPSNIGIVAVILLTSSAWAAPGQWGQAMWLFLLLGGLGLIPLIGFSRLLTSISFLLIFSALILLRSLWLGDPWQIPMHQLQNGALLIFTFYMLSDPMTTPDNTLGRIIFGSWLAVLAWVLQFMFYIPNAFLYALAVSMPLVVLLNQRFKGQHFQWSNTKGAP